MAGGFCLRSGFPDWFGRGRRWRRVEKSGVGERKGGRPLRAGDGDSQIQKQTSIESRTRALSPSISAISAQSSVISGPPSSALASIRTSARGRDLCIIQVLQYMRSSFEDEIVLDHLPIEAAANPGAWHAWRSYRASTGHILEVPVQDKPTGDAAAIEGSGEETPPAGYQRLAGGTSFARGTRRPGEWSWDGVWEERVRRGIEQSNSDAVLYGNLRGNDELIRFLDLSADMMATTKESLKRSTDVAAAR
ncbi:MAG: hypothetical protein M1812_007397 [Candelaria pacifica]|nr:MAG: hypothetical protein M1812_007397 [Candelaria pacifica]